MLLFWFRVNYTECTTACLTAMSLFNSYYPDYRAADIRCVPLPFPIRLFSLWLNFSLALVGPAKGRSSLCIQPNVGMVRGTAHGEYGEPTSASLRSEYSTR
jgi:hypothetical protein